MSVRIDYEAALIEHDDCAAFEGERGDCINLDDMKAIVDAALPDGDLYQHDGEPRVSDGNHMTASECVVHAIEWGMMKVERGNP